MNVVSLFCGIGGFDSAFAQEGHQVIWANDNDYYAIQTYMKNNSNVEVSTRDIRSISTKEIPRMDILTAGFPCQSFSTMGYQKGFQDSRGNLFFEIMRVIDAHKPRVVLLENVRNLLNHDYGQTFKVIEQQFYKQGYYVKYQVLSPHNYANIPQERQRVFIIGFRDKIDYEKYIFPVEMVLDRKINDIIDRSVRHHDIFYYTDKHKDYELLCERVVDKEVIYRIDDSGIAKRKWEMCPTLKANMGTYPDRVPIIKDDFGIRKITPYECLRFQGFPEEFKIPNIPLNQVYKQCGNTVCVDVVKRIVSRLSYLT